MKNTSVYNLFLLLLIFVASCHPNSTDPPTGKTQPLPPVTLTAISYGPMSTTIQFNARSMYLNKEIIRSPIAGYVTKVNISPGDRVDHGTQLFTIQSQESKALEGVKLKNDSLFIKIPGVDIPAPRSGIISLVSYQAGGFVQQGEQLGELIALHSFVFVMNVPFEYRKKISKGKRVSVKLPGGSKIKATVGDPLPTSTSDTQVQSLLLRPESPLFIPENLTATVEIKINTRENVQRVPQSSVLTNEVQDKFWVMKLINDTTAIQVPIVKGLTTDSLLEVIKPQFSPQDKLLLSGQYGLPDTAYVKIVKK